MSNQKAYLVKLDKMIEELQSKMQFYDDDDRENTGKYATQILLVGSDLSDFKHYRTLIGSEDVSEKKNGLVSLKKVFEERIRVLRETDRPSTEITDKTGKVIAKSTMHQTEIEIFAALIVLLVKELENLKGWRDRFTTYEQGSAEREKVTEVKYLIENTLSKDSFILLAGETGHGKTSFSMLLGICLASGKDFLGNKVLEKCNVLYIDEENKASILKERQDLIQAGLGLDKVSNFYPMSSQGFNFDNEEDLKYLEEMIRELKIGVVIVDSLAVTTGYNENVSSGFANLYAKNLKVLTKKYGLSWILIQHLSKGTIKSMKTENLLKLVRGSSALFYLADDCLFLKKEKDRLTIIPCKARASELGRPKDLKIIWSDKIEFVSLGESTIGMNAAERFAAELLKYCKTNKVNEVSTRKADKDKSIAEVRAEHRSSPDTVNRAIRLLKQDGKILPKEEGIYVLV